VLEITNPEEISYLLQFETSYMRVLG